MGAALSSEDHKKILYRIDRSFPEIIQTEIKHINRVKTELKHLNKYSEDDDLNRILFRLGYQSLRELYRHSKASQIFGECIKEDLQRRESENATNSKVQRKLNEWNRQK